MSMSQTNGVITFLPKKIKTVCMLKMIEHFETYIGQLN